MSTSIPVDMFGKKVGRTSYNITTKSGIAEFIKKRSTLLNMAFSNRNFDGINFSGPGDMSGCVFTHCSFVGANFTSVSNFGAGANIFNACDFTNANFSGAFLYGKAFVFTNCMFYGVNLRHAAVDITRFILGLNFVDWRVTAKLSDKSKYFLHCFDKMTHPKPSSFDKWASSTFGGPCPYQGSRSNISTVTSHRPLHFGEDAKEYRKGKENKYGYSVAAFFKSICKDLSIIIDEV